MGGNPERRPRSEHEELAAAGRTRRVRETEQVAAQLRELDEARIRNVLMERGPLLAVLGVLALGVPGVCAAAYSARLPDEEAAFNLGAALGLGTGVFFAVRWLVARGAIRRERARLAALGFPIDGWFEVMRDAHFGDFRQHIQLKFRSSSPPPEALAELMARVAAEPNGGPLRWKSPHNPVLEFQDQLLAEVLVPLHARHPLACVTLKLEREPPHRPALDCP